MEGPDGHAYGHAVTLQARRIYLLGEVADAGRAELIEHTGGQVLVEVQVGEGGQVEEAVVGRRDGTCGLKVGVHLQNISPSVDCRYKIRAAALGESVSIVGEVVVAGGARGAMGLYEVGAQRFGKPVPEFSV